MIEMAGRDEAFHKYLTPSNILQQRIQLLM